MTRAAGSRGERVSSSEGNRCECGDASDAIEDRGCDATRDLDMLRVDATGSSVRSDSRYLYLALDTTTSAIPRGSARTFVIARVYLSRARPRRSDCRSEAVTEK